MRQICLLLFFLTIGWEFYSRGIYGVQNGILLDLLWLSIVSTKPQSDDGIISLNESVSELREKQFEHETFFDNAGKVLVETRRSMDEMKKQFKYLSKTIETIDQKTGILGTSKIDI